LSFLLSSQSQTQQIAGGLHIIPDLANKTDAQVKEELDKAWYSQLYVAFLTR
jgi:hypothetical protein